MMRLELMWRVLDHLKNDDSQLVKRMLARWGTDVDNVQFFRASANFVFTFRMSDTPYYLRFNHESERTEEAINQELAYISYLAENALNVAKTISSLHGEIIESVSSELGTFHAVVFEVLEGKQYEAEELNAQQLVEWGRTLGKLHKFSSTYVPTKRSDWRDQLEWAKTYLPPDEKAALDLADKLKQRLNSLPTSQDKHGLIHGDFELDNLVWQGDIVKILDFDDCSYAWFAADVSYALRDLFDDNPLEINLTSPKFAAFIKGYREEKALSYEDLAYLPTFSSFHNLLSFTKLLRSRENLESAKYPEWTRQLNEKVERKISGYRDRFMLLQAAL